MQTSHHTSSVFLDLILTVCTYRVFSCLFFSRSYLCLHLYTHHHNIPLLVPPYSPIQVERKTTRSIADPVLNMVAFGNVDATNIHYKVVKMERKITNMKNTTAHTQTNTQIKLPLHTFNINLWFGISMGPTGSPNRYINHQIKKKFVSFYSKKGFTQGEVCRGPNLTFLFGTTLGSSTQCSVNLNYLK